MRVRDGDGEVRSIGLLLHHPQVLCFAGRNRGGRFFIPMTFNNYFGGGAREPCLVGCSSTLLPFPLQNGLPQTWLEEFYEWPVSSLRVLAPYNIPFHWLVTFDGNVGDDFKSPAVDMHGSFPFSTWKFIMRDCF